MNNQDERFGMALCIRDHLGCIVKQNRACQRLCGERFRQKCAGGCNRYYIGSPNVGLEVHRNVDISGRNCDLVFAKLKSRLFTFFELHEEKYQTVYALIAEANLSKCEEKVLRLKIAGLKNSEIANQLHVTRSTVKSHLLHAYQKIGVEKKSLLAYIKREKK